MGDVTQEQVRFVQVAVSGVQNTANTQADYIIVALDDQGRIWERLGSYPWCLHDNPTNEERRFE